MPSRTRRPTTATTPTAPAATCWFVSCRCAQPGCAARAMDNASAAQRGMSRACATPPQAASHHEGAPAKPGNPALVPGHRGSDRLIDWDGAGTSQLLARTVDDKQPLDSSAFRVAALSHFEISETKVAEPLIQSWAKCSRLPCLRVHREARPMPGLHLRVNGQAPAEADMQRVLQGQSAQRPSHDRRARSSRPHPPSSSAAPKHRSHART
jgi:hypothetical protein